jgi:hypothetical protein
MSTPNLNTYVRGRTERREQQMQTAFPAKVLGWSSSTNTVKLEPQFIETWVTRDGTTKYEEPYNTFIDNVPVCYPWHMTWDITVGAFGLVICTKYSLDQWRQQLRRMDPGDLRRFTMSGATFHPVVIGESPNLTQQFVALENLVKSELDDIWDLLGGGSAGGSKWTVVLQDGGGALQTAAAARVTAGSPGEVGSATVKVSE